MHWRPSRAQSPWLFALAVALLVVAVVLPRWSGPFWLMLALAIVSSVGGLWLRRLQADAERKDQQNDVVENATRTLEEGGRQEKVCDVDLQRLGVHRAHVRVDYVHRAAETELLALLSKGGPVLVLGQSMAGKTRMAAEVLREHFADRLILLPSPPDGLSLLATERAQPEGMVVWLDDLDRHLAGEGIRVEWLDRMVQRGNLVVATMRASEHARYQPDSKLRPAQGELLERFELLRLRPDDDAEREHLAASIDDPGLRAGIARYGLAEYVGGGYLAVQRLEDAHGAPHPHGHPLGVAMVRAAVDWRRVGLDVIPATSLAALAPMYLPERYRYDPGEDTAAAKTWATELVDATTRLLEPADDQGGTRAFDYILDYLSTDSADGSRTASDVPEHTWREAMASAPPERRIEVAGRAYDSEQDVYAEAILRQVSDDQHNPATAWMAMINLGVLLQDQGRLDEAATVFHKTVDSGDPASAPIAILQLGELAKKQGQFEEAMKHFHQAIASGHFEATAVAKVRLGELTKEQGRLDEAAALFQEAITLGHPSAGAAAAYNLGDLIAKHALAEQDPLVRQQFFEQAVELMTHAADHAHPEVAPRAAINLGVLLIELSRYEEAEATFQRTINSGPPEAAYTAAINLGVLLRRLDRHDEAVSSFRYALESSRSDILHAAEVNLRELKEQGHAEQGGVGNELLPRLRRDTADWPARRARPGRRQRDDR